jgi:FG-GAP-like repeat
MNLLIFLIGPLNRVWHGNRAGSTRLWMAFSPPREILVAFVAASLVLEILSSSSAVASAQCYNCFGPNQDWTHGPYYGSRGTYFVDVDGDRRADAIVVNDTGITVRRSTGTSFGPYETWSNVPYYGGRGTYFADVDGDRLADAIVVNDAGITVRRSTGMPGFPFGDSLIGGFGPYETWWDTDYYGPPGTYFASVNYDRRADAIAVNRYSTVRVRFSTGTSFEMDQDLTHGPYYGTRGTYFVDVNYDGMADAIAVNDDTITVRRSTGTSFGPNEDWTHGPYYGSRGTYFADVDCDLLPDAIVVNDNTVTVRRSNGGQFLPNEDWTYGPYYGSRGTYFADVTGDGRADAIVVNDYTVTVRPSLADATCKYPYQGR